MLRYWFLPLLVLLFIVNDLSAYEININVNANHKEISFQNTFLTAELSYASDIHLTSLSALKTDFLWREGSSTSSPEVRPGNFLVLFAQNPDTATETISLPQDYKATKSVLDATTTELIVESITPTQVSLSRKIVLTSNESMIRMTTHIRNETDQPLTIYPTENITYNTEFGNSGMPNINLSLMAPIKPDAFQIIRSASPNNPFRIFKKEQVLNVLNRSTLGEIKATGHGNWLAVMNGLQAGPIGAFEFQYPDQKPQPVSNNLRIFLNGSVSDSDNPLSTSPFTGFQKYMQVSQILGKITIDPGKDFIYNTIWSFVVCNGPVIEVHDGIITKRPLYVSYGGMGFYVFATLGLPQEGFIRLEFYNDINELLKDTIPSLVTDYQAKVKRPAYSVPSYPTVLQHEIWFSAEEDVTKTSSENEMVLKDARKVRLSLLDLNMNFIRTLAESNGPWQEFVMPEQPEAVEIGID